MVKGRGVVKWMKKADSGVWAIIRRPQSQLLVRPTVGLWPRPALARGLC